MSRTVKKIPFAGDFSEIKANIERMLAASGYNQTTLKTGEQVWKKGNGLLSGMKFIKAEYDSQSVIITAWVSSGIGDTVFNEIALDGIGAMADRKSLRYMIEQLISIIQ